MVVIVSWAIENNIFGDILVGPGIMIVSWAIENKLVYLRTILIYDSDRFLGY